MSRLVVGIDPSMTCTAVAMGRTVPMVDSYTSKPRGKDVRNRIERCDALAREVAESLGEQRGALVVLEGYSFGSRNGGEKLGEFGGLLRRRLLSRHEVVEVSPSELKKAVTGKGNAAKDAMILAIERRFPGRASDNNEADALGLWMIGALMLGVDVPHIKAAEDVAKKIKARVGQLEEPRSSQVAGSNPASGMGAPEFADYCSGRVGCVSALPAESEGSRDV